MPPWDVFARNAATRASVALTQERKNILDLLRKRSAKREIAAARKDAISAALKKGRQQGNRDGLVGLGKPVASDLASHAGSMPIKAQDDAIALLKELIQRRPNASLRFVSVNRTGGNIELYASNTSGTARERVGVVGTYSIQPLADRERSDVSATPFGMTVSIKERSPNSTEGRSLHIEFRRPRTLSRIQAVRLPKQGQLTAARREVLSAFSRARRGLEE